MLDAWEVWGLYVEGVEDQAAFEAICKTIVTSHANRAQCSLNLQQWQAAKQDCMKARSMVDMHGPFEGVTDDLLTKVQHRLKQAIAGLVDLAR
eukprot:8653287-Pyramimonas_sp.AAC.2